MHATSSPRILNPRHASYIVIHDAVAEGPDRHALGARTLVFLVSGHPINILRREYLTGKAQGGAYAEEGGGGRGEGGGGGGCGGGGLEEGGGGVRMWGRG
jgi:hypothetical protein